jgi:periplasmic divalent cation tolerance protein
MHRIARLLTLCPDLATARAIAQALLEARLIACANIGAKVESHYLWNGTQQNEPEVQLWLKTREDLVERAFAAIRRHHPYEVPMIAADTIRVDADYAAWVNETTL